MLSCKLISVTPDAEKLMAYCARVSSPKQDNPDIAGLLKYCIKHQHWSVFEMAHMVIEIETSRAVAPQLLRHRSFSFQEFSQRYAVASEPHWGAPRRQDTKNRQNSIDDLEEQSVLRFQEMQSDVWDKAVNYYLESLSMGVAKECARELLPLGTKTKLYMAGSIRSWIHYLTLRSGGETQLEHRLLALEIKDIFKQEFPVIALALDWK